MPESSDVIGSQREFQQAVRLAFDAAAETGARELWLSDVDFAGWPLGERRVVASLARWAAPHRRLTLIGAQFDAVARCHPRWTAWRRAWSHIICCRTAGEADAAHLPTLMLMGETLAIRLADPIRYRGRVEREPADLVRARHQIDALLQRSAGALPVTPTGL